eukprot:217924-Chlamydomonas_euryale.AAC.2
MPSPPTPLAHALATGPRLHRQRDEEPLYVFDSDFVEAAPRLRSLYEVPCVFSEDMFALLGDNARPMFRWLVAGPARAGASWHVDPSLTSAWNALLHGAGCPVNTLRPAERGGGGGPNPPLLE